MPGISIDADIEALDFSPVWLLLNMEHGWSLKRIIAAERAYKIMWHIKRRNLHIPLVLDPDCDKFLHCHLMLNAIYIEQSIKIFGIVPIHNPFTGRLGPEDAARQRKNYQNTQKLLSCFFEKTVVKSK